MVTEPLDRSVLSYMHHQLIILDEDIDAATAVKLMHDKKAETIIVKNKKDEYVGIITDSDILDKIVMKGEDSDQVFIKSIMSSPLITISARANVRQALELMRLNVIKRIPVTDNIHILGIVTQEGLAHVIRTSVLEKTFRPYRAVIREHYKPIWGNLGFILQFAGLLFIGPAILATSLGEMKSAIGMFLCITSMFVTGFVLNSYGEKTPMNLRQASVLMVSSFVLLSFFGSIPYMYVNPFYTDIDPFSLVVKSFFESASGFTTTGLSQLLHPEDLPKSFDFYRSFTQWIGGLSFIYLIMAFFYPERKLAHMKSMISGGGLKLKQLLLTITVIFTIYTVVLIILLYIFGYENAIYNLSLIFSAITGGGFVPTSTSLNLQDNMQMLILMTGMIISALPFAFHFAIFSKEMHTTKMRPEIYTYFAIIAVSIIVFYFLIASTDFSSKPMFAMFHVISASTNTGFQLVEMSVLSDQGKILLIIIMLIGGTAFSMAGGIKVGRILQMVQKITKKRFVADASTRSISGVSSRYNNHQDLNRHEPKSEKIKEEKTFREALLIIVLFIVVSFATAIVLWYVEQKGFLNSLFESVSALTTTGITTGITAPNMSNISQIFLIFNMIAGRFEIIAIIYFFLEISKRKH
ncbi:potassium transporter TrkG [Candidatus Nitrosocosmicus arcticus]|uniref:K+ transport system, membrane component n=1 Tax=Candidatus Nitrosocosmicus arcticus TaxID=2035267 RepID=A0A557SWJ1_9ARCH|nr:potassium transporter TrkG [Candidatus Nitrosocosmicus arcticus]TVP40966.1 K+ transport system, membrane component [Candidatus Nitrosocosmicus arcticus]